ncbi:MAG: prolyl-tRNA synthetase associated domain-containing protein [Clostridia bacterium]|nr:prolyl-tRNA synthetase associated domain-containing protein [Clostridia bacterium]
MITNLQLGRPRTRERRLDREVRVYDFLDELEIEYWRIDHDAAFTMEACEEIDKVLEATICKNLFLCNRQKTEFYLLMMPGDKPFKTKELSAQIGSSRLSFAGEEDMLKYLDIEPGSLSFLGLMNDSEKKVQLLVDEDLLKGEWIGMHPCVNTSSLKIKTADVFGKILKKLGREMRTVKLIGE